MTLEISLIFDLKTAWMIDYTTRHKIMQLWA